MIHKELKENDSSSEGLMNFLTELGKWTGAGPESGAAGGVLGVRAARVKAASGSG